MTRIPSTNSATYERVSPASSGRNPYLFLTGSISTERSCLLPDRLPGCSYHSREAGTASATQDRHVRVPAADVDSPAVPSLPVLRHRRRARNEAGGDATVSHFASRAPGSSKWRGHPGRAPPMPGHQPQILGERLRDPLPHCPPTDPEVAAEGTERLTVRKSLPFTEIRFPSPDPCRHGPHFIARHVKGIHSNVLGGSQLLLDPGA